MRQARRKNWFTAMGLLFIIVAAIALVRDLLIWGPDFMVDFFTSPDITSEKVSTGICGVGVFLIIIGLRGETGED